MMYGEAAIWTLQHLIVDTLLSVTHVVTNTKYIQEEGERNSQVARKWRGQSYAPTDRWRNNLIVSS